MAGATDICEGRRKLWCGAGLLLALAASAVLADPSAVAQKAYWETQKRYAAEPGDAKAAWGFGRACFDLGEYATNNTERALLAEQGIAACRRLVASDAASAPGHYYLGMNLGQLARTRGLSALKLVDEMEREFLRAERLDEHFDHGGPDRNLGLLYRDAPSIGSVGSRSKARKHLQRAVELAPDFPENRLNLIEACINWGDRNGARRELKALEAQWESSRQEFSGPDWTASWADWQQRLQKFRQKVEEPSRALETPRH